MITAKWNHCYGLDKNKPGTGAPNYVAGLLAKTLASEMWRGKKTLDFH